MLSDLPALVVLAVPVLVIRPWLAEFACPPPLSPAAHVAVRDGVAGGGQAWLARAASKHVDGKSSRKFLPLVPLPPQGPAPAARLLGGQATALLAGGGGRGARGPGYNLWKGERLGQ